jgi:hypothetical protein
MITARRPYGPAAGDVERRPFPAGSGPVGHWKWRISWKSLPTDMLKMQRAQRNRHFQISKSISMDMKAGSSVGHRERLVGVSRQADIRRAGTGRCPHIIVRTANAA